MRLVRGIIFLLMACLFWQVQAQVNPDSVRTGRDDGDDVLDQVIEDAVTDIETDDQTDWTIFTDVLQDYKDRPLNINTASKEELLFLPGMTVILVNNFLSYIQEFGKLTSIFELQAVQGFDAEVFSRIRPYIVVRETRAKDISPGTQHPAGPPFGEVLRESRHELLLRYVRGLELQKGYTPRPPGDSTSSRYAGNANKYYARYRMRYNQNFSMALVGEKDQGEEFKWDPANKFYGFDFLAGHLAIRDYGHIKRLVVGDYNIQVGQGILLSTGLGFGKGSQAVNAVKRPGLGIRPYASVNENQYMRGAATTVAFGPMYFTGFISRSSRDGNTDTLDNESAVEILSLQTSGLHRTQSEIADKNSVQETIYGGRVEYKKRWLTVGATHFYQTFGQNRVRGSRPYQAYNFEGKQNYLSGLDFDATFRNLNFFGEIGRSKSGGTGMVMGMLASLHPKVDLALQFRNFDRNFNAYNPYVFAERPTAAQNERGTYLGVTVTPNPKWIFSTYFDQFSFPWATFSAALPSKGHEYFTQLEYKPSRSMSVYVRWRSDNKERNASVLPEGQNVEMLVPTQRNGLRLHFAYKVTRNLTIKSRVEKSWYKRGFEDALEEDHGGILAYQDLSWKIGWKWRLTGRYAVFDAEDYDARIYAYENDILGFFSIPAYSGRGTRTYLMLNYKPVKGLQFWARYARTKFYYDETIGSGLSEIIGDTRSEIKLQMQLTF